MEIALQMGADVNSKSNDGTPIFVEACKDAEERKNICFMLLEHGSDSAMTDEVARFGFLLIAFTLYFKFNSLFVYSKLNYLI